MPGEENEIPIVLRQALPDDEEFLLKVFESACERILPYLPLDAAGKQRFVRSQYDAMTSSRLQIFPDCSREIIEIGARPAGFLSLDRNGTRVRIVDITLLPEFRNMGIGGALLRRILAEADECRMAVDLRVERDNPAKRLYERIGFTMVADDGVYVTMVRESSC